MAEAKYSIGDKVKITESCENSLGGKTLPDYKSDNVYRVRRVLSDRTLIANNHVLYAMNEDDLEEYVPEDEDGDDDEDDDPSPDASQTSPTSPPASQETNQNGGQGESGPTELGGDSHVDGTFSAKGGSTPIIPTYSTNDYSPDDKVEF